jgi:hypothetical protein
MSTNLKFSITQTGPLQMKLLKWRRTSEKETFELNGAEAVSNKINDPRHMILYQICSYSVQVNEGDICKNCKVTLTIMVGDEREIYSYEKSRHTFLGGFKSIKEAKNAAEEIDNFVIKG